MELPIPSPPRHPSRPGLTFALCVLGFAGAGNAAAALPAGAASSLSPLDSAFIRRELVAMGNSSTNGHPDLFGQYTGWRLYADHDYAGAIKYFTLGAYYADKVSQLCLGLIYLNGNGVPADPVQAWAWLSLAAERGYPEFVATRDRVWAQLDAAQRAQAETEAKTLAVTYGDKVAQPRMLAELRRAASERTGSRTGFDAGAYTYMPDNGPTLTPDPNNLRSRWYWDPKTYFAGRDAQWKGTVTVGPLKNLHGTPAPADSAPPPK